jgi:glycine cleavage system H protein
VIPDDLHYTAEHEWVKVVAEGVRVGITDHAQEALGDIVFVTLPAPGTQVVSGQTLGEVESTKSV